MELTGIETQKQVEITASYQKAKFDSVAGLYAVSSLVDDSQRDFFDEMAVLYADNTSGKIEKGKEKAMEVLLKYGHNPYGIPALHYAIIQKDEEAISVLLDYGIDPNSSISNWTNTYDLTGFYREPLPSTAMETAAAFGTSKI